MSFVEERAKEARETKRKQWEEIKRRDSALKALLECLSETFGKVQLGEVKWLR